MDDNNLKLNEALDIFAKLLLQHFSSYYKENNKNNNDNKNVIIRRHCTMPIDETDGKGKKIICDKIIENEIDFFSFNS